MRIVLCVFLSAAALLGGCDKASALFNEEYDKGYRANCLEMYAEDGVPDAEAVQACDCLIGETNKRYSASEKLTLSDEQLEQVVGQCLI